MIAKAGNKLASGGAPEFLWIKRAARGTGGSFRGQYAFPGGVTDIEDFSSRWEHLLKQGGQCCMPTKYLHGPTPPAFAENRMHHAPNQQLNAEIAFKICAIRETFEETGLLLTNPSISLPHDETNAARTRISKDAGWFFEFCSSLKVSPATDRLKLWSNWLTPAMKGWKRFDTIFFAASLDSHEAEVFEEQTHTLAAAEISTSLFASPVTALTTPEILAHMAPPQVYEMCRMLSFQTASELERFACGREQFGAEQFLTVFNRYRETSPTHSKNLISCSLFPGDYMYPQNVDPENEAESVPFVSTAELPPAHEVTDDKLPLHRLELYQLEHNNNNQSDKNIVNRFICNLNNVAGVPEYLARHVYPKNGYEIFAQPAMKP